MAEPKISTRDSILEACRALFDERGPSKVTTAGIAVAQEHVARACLCLASGASAFPVGGTRHLAEGGVTVGPATSWIAAMASSSRQLIEGALAGMQSG